MVVVRSSTAEAPVGPTEAKAIGAGARARVVRRRWAAGAGSPHRAATSVRTRALCAGGAWGAVRVRCPAVTDARAFLRSLQGKQLKTITGRENRILDVAGGSVRVWTTRSPGGQNVPLSWVQDALDRLERDGEVEI